MTRGRNLYERYRLLDITAEAWPWLDPETREFWERLAKAAA